MSQPKPKLSLKPNINKINSAAIDWVNGSKTETQKHRDTESQLTTETQKHRDTESELTTEALQHRDTKSQLTTETQKHRDTESQLTTETQKHGDTDSIAKKQFKRITLDVSPELHYKLKKHNLETGEPMAELLRRLASDFFKTKN